MSVLGGIADITLTSALGQKADIEFSMH